MSRPHGVVLLLLAVLSLVLSGCGGFKGVLTPTLSSITPTTVAAGSAAFTLTATGTNFTGGTTILWDGAALPTTVSSSTQLTAKVTAAQIASAGAVSVRVMRSDSTTSDAMTLTVTGGSTGGTFSLTSISPAAVAAGSPAFTLTAAGVGFVSGAAITVNGTALATTFDSATQLHATIPATNLATAATVALGVTNPDKSTTNTLPLTVFANSGLGPAPTLKSINPNTSTNGVTAPLTLTAIGTNFVSGGTVLWNGVAMTTTYVSSTMLTASIPAKYINVPASAFDPTTGVATANVFVLNSDSTVSNELPFTITPFSPPTPGLVTIFNPLKTQRSKVGDSGFALTLCGKQFAASAKVNFGSLVLSASAVAPAGTDCQSLSPATNQPTQQVTVQVPGTVLTEVAEFKVTIQNPNSAVSNDIPYYVGMNVYFDESADVVWDSRNNLLYISKPSTSQNSKDAIVALSTRAGLNDKAAAWIYQFLPGANPDRLALSADGKYLYVGLDGKGQVQQLAISSATTAPAVGNTISLGVDPVSGAAYQAIDLQVLPTNSSTIAVARGAVPPQSNASAMAIGGVAIYDNTKQRPNVVGPSSVLGNAARLDNLQWSADGTKIYSSNNEDNTGDLYELSVDQFGVKLTSDTRGIFTVPNLFIHLDPTTTSQYPGGLLYGDDGLQIDPNVPTIVGGNLLNGIMTLDPTDSTAYYVAQPAKDANQLEYYVFAYSIPSFSSTGSLDLYQVQGIPQHIVRWNNSSDGTSGVAFTTEKFSCRYSPCTVGDGRLYVINSQLPLP